MIPIRKECPPGACVCQREALLAGPQADLRILRLTKEEEAKLLARLETLQTLPELRRMQASLQTQLGIQLTIAPGANEVQTVRGFDIQITEQPGLCRKTQESTTPDKTRQCRRSLQKHPA